MFNHSVNVSGVPVMDKTIQGAWGLGTPMRMHSGEQEGHGVKEAGIDQIRAVQ